MPSSHPYEEPSLRTFLIISGFPLTLNVVAGIFDWVNSGLIGQIFIGVLFGSPGTKLFDDQTQTIISTLGYLGLILLVYEGGISLAVSDILSSSLMSLAVALTGITLPIAFSFLLLTFNANPLQCFVAGAALSSTSLGTTFTILSNNGFVHTPIGTILTTAAMFDDVAGLIMLQIVTNIGHESSPNWAEIICRPIGVSIGLILVSYISCRWLLLPLKSHLHALNGLLSRCKFIKPIWGTPPLYVCFHTAILLAFITAGSYLGTSVLFSAFIAGSVVRWWDDAMLSSPGHDEKLAETYTAMEIYQHYYSIPNERFLKPFFFASLGFAIPISQMVRGRIIWKGVVYSIFMFIGKFMTGIWPWLVPKLRQVWPYRRHVGKVNVDPHQPGGTDESKSGDPVKKEEPVVGKHGPLFLGFAMVARGEIGFLIASLAATQGLFNAKGQTNSPLSGDEDLYLITLWAIVLCTIIGPFSVGFLIRRSKQLLKT